MDLRGSMKYSRIGIRLPPEKTTSQGSSSNDFIEELEELEGLVEGEVKSIFQKAKAVFEEL